MRHLTLSISTVTTQLHIPQDVRGVGESINYPLDKKSLVLCSAAPLPPEDDQRTIHVIMQYNVCPTFFIAIPVIVVLAFICVLETLLLNIKFKFL